MSSARRSYRTVSRVPFLWPCLGGHTSSTLVRVPIAAFVTHAGSSGLDFGYLGSFVDPSPGAGGARDPGMAPFSRYWQLVLEFLDLVVHHFLD